MLFDLEFGVKMFSTWTRSKNKTEPFHSDATCWECALVIFVFAVKKSRTTLKWIEHALDAVLLQIITTIDGVLPTSGERANEWTNEKKKIKTRPNVQKENWCELPMSHIKQKPQRSILNRMQWLAMFRRLESATKLFKRHSIELLRLLDQLYLICTAIHMWTV